MPTEARTLLRETATIGFVDVVESVRLMAAAEVETVERIRSLLDRAAAEEVPAFGGRVAERRGDGLVLKFATVRDATQCMARLHALAAAPTPEHPAGEPLRLRAGVHKTELLADDHSIYGAGVNLAARIAALGEPGDTLLSATARDDLVAPLDGLLEDIGPCWLKHLDRPVRIFRHRERHPPLPTAIEDSIGARMRLRPVVAILPLDGTPLDHDTPFGLGDVVADQVIRRLSASSVLHVISAQSTRALHGVGAEPAKLYEVLRADYVFGGRIEGDAHGVRLNGALWRRGSAEPVWEDAIAGPATDLLSADGEIVGRLVHALSRRIVTVEQRTAAAAALPTLASHTLYLAAVDMLHRFSVEHFQRAREILLTLADRAPRHPEPLAWLARWHVFRLVQGWSDHAARDSDEALRYSDRALDRDPHSSLALTMAGSVHAGVKRDAATAQRLYGQALAHNPNDSMAWLMSSVAQGFMNAGEPALAASDMALGLAPVDPTRHYYDALSATAALRAGAYERCVALAQRAITANGSHGTAYRSMAIAQAELGRREEAAATVRRLLAVEPHFTVRNYLARVPSQDARREHYARLLQEAGLQTD
jgi:class 3 adenylate cyclase/tetratricopeptide (TPR) repeat protein